MAKESRTLSLVFFYLKQSEPIRFTCDMRLKPALLLETKTRFTHSSSFRPHSDFVQVSLDQPLSLGFPLVSLVFSQLLLFASDCSLFLRIFTKITETFLSFNFGIVTTGVVFDCPSWRLSFGSNLPFSVNGVLVFFVFSYYSPLFNIATSVCLSNLD